MKLWQKNYAKIQILQFLICWTFVGINRKSFLCVSWPGLTLSKLIQTYSSLSERFCSWWKPRAWRISCCTVEWYRQPFLFREMYCFFPWRPTKDQHLMCTHKHQLKYLSYVILLEHLYSLDTSYKTENWNNMQMSTYQISTSFIWQLFAEDSIFHSDNLFKW